MGKRLFQLVLFFFIGSFSNGQTLEERKVIIEVFDLNSFNEFKSSLELKKASNDLMIETYLLSNPLDKSLRYGQGELFL